ncbi:MAG TPA: hypothetical protein VGI90_16330 [Steroidobacteraceae bacterium]|jgi:hypothetical protein
MKAIVYAIIMAAATIACQAATAQGAQAVIKAPPLQPWQARRAQLDQTIRAAENGDPTATKQFDQVLTDLEKSPYGRTPIENLEIMGAYYLPNEGVETTLPLIVTNLLLGWYDTLRFASSSGKAEILNNEHFFDKAFVLSNSDVTAKARAFMQSHPEQVAKLLAQGFGYAEKSREIQSYDRHWPTAYGLERIICASGGDCKERPSLPKDQWDTAWLEAKNQVNRYFNVKPATATR